MKYKYPIPLFGILALSIFLIWQSALQVGANNSVSTGVGKEGRVFYLYAAETPSTVRIPPPANFQRAPETATIIVNYQGSWSNEARTAFQYAVDIWETQINSSVTIYVDAEYSALPDGVLGGAGPNGYRRDFSGAPQPSTWYPIALANALAGSDLNGGTSELGAAFSNKIDWYFGTDGNPPNDKFDFVSVVLHEIGHGLGFAGSMTVDDGAGQVECTGTAGVGCWGTGTAFPDIYDRFTENRAGQVLILQANFPNNSVALANQLTGNNLYFDGPNTRAANGGQPARIYAPGSWQPGSSYSHLDQATYQNTANGLMTPFLSPGASNLSPGPLGLAILADMGWGIGATTPATPTPSPTPSPSPTPVQEPQLDLPPAYLLEVNQTADNALDLWEYASDAQSTDAQLTYELVSVSNASAGVTIDVDDYVDINPAGGWTGQSTVTIRVTDPDNNSATDSFVVVVAASLEDAYLPAITDD